MGVELDVDVLGPLRVYRDRTLVRLGPQQATLLSVLLIESCRSVPATRLVELLWDVEAPASAQATLRSHVANLRRALEPERSGTSSVLLTVGTGPGLGYELRLPPARSDAHRFERACAEGERLVRAGAPAQGVEMIHDALGLWRGTAFADVADRPFAAPRITRLNALRRTARSTYAEALFALGRHGEVAGELANAITEDPYDEGQRRLLALALYHQHRVNEAAEVCREGVALLRERGLDAPDLQDLHRAILCRELSAADQPAQSPARSPAHRSTPPARPTTHPPVDAAAVPCLLPGALPRLVGRTDEIEQARHHLLGHDNGPATVVVTGPAGVGKTSFVVHVAHTVAAEFPDGQLYTDLRGTQPEPMDPAEVLGGFLRALGVRGQAVPDGLTERVHMYRTLLARRRVLVVLDNAADARQVRDLLLPNGIGCAAMVTSRTSLASLHGTRMMLRMLTTGQALALLGDLVGAKRIAAEPEAASTIVERCDRLPLAVWVAGARLAARPHLGLAEMAWALTDQHHRLDELTVDDLAVRASVELSYRSLDTGTQRALRLLGLLRAGDFAPWALAALLDTTLARAERLVDELIEVHLVDIDSTEPAGTRYRIHDLVRLVAHERALEEEPPQDRAAALRRVLGASLDLAEQSDLELRADFLGVVRHRLERWRLAPSEVDRLTANPLAWFNRENAFLVAAVHDGLDAGATDLAGCLAASLTTFFQIRNQFDDWRRLQSRALSVVTAAQDRRPAMKLHRSLGELDTIQDRYAEAVSHFQAALDYEAPHEPEYEAAIMSGLGTLHRLLGNYEAAVSHFRRATRLAQQTGNVNSLVYALAGIGVVHLECRQLAQAREHFAEGLRLSRDADYRPGEAQALRGLGHVERAENDYVAAAEFFGHAMDVSGGFGDRLGHTHAACWFGEARIHQNQPAQGRKLLARCLWIYREFGNSWGEASTLWALANAQFAAGRPDLAGIRAAQAVAIWRRIASPYWLACGLDTLAEALDEIGQHDAAQQNRAEADGLRQRLAATAPAVWPAPIRTQTKHALSIRHTIGNPLVEHF